MVRDDTVGQVEAGRRWPRAGHLRQKSAAKRQSKIFASGSRSLQNSCRVILKRFKDSFIISQIDSMDRFKDPIDPLNSFNRSEESNPMI